MKLFFFFFLCVFLQNVSSDEPGIICEVSHQLKDLLNSSKTDNKQFDPEECAESEKVKSLLDAMGIAGKVIGAVANLNFSCFAVTVNTRFGKDLKYRGCMPQGTCNIVERVFTLIRNAGGIKGMITKFLFTGAKCAECYGKLCNTPPQKRGYGVANMKLSCEVSPLKPIIYSSNLEDLSYKPEECFLSKNVTFMINKFENVGVILPEKSTYQCFTMTAKMAIDQQPIEVRGCVPKGHCKTVEKIFKQIPSMDHSNKTLHLFNEATCKECDGDMCNTPTLPKGELALAPVSHLSTSLILIVFVQFLV